jgi:enoyl-CoA hydratase/carnithine racemase
MIDVKSQDGLWHVTLNRPEKANALTAQMLERLIEVVGEAHGSAKALVITGAGPIFCAGADLDEAHVGLAVSDLWETLSGAVANLPCLTVCALNGTLAGGAFGMALACDVRLSVPHAKFFYPVMRLGFLPQPSDAKRLASLIGPARSKMILMAGEKIDTAEALSWGLIDRVVASDQLDAAARDLCALVLQAKASHIQAIKTLSSL